MLTLRLVLVACVLGGALSLGSGQQDGGRAGMGWYETRFVDSVGVPVAVAALEAESGFNSLGRRVVLTVSCYGSQPAVRLHWDEPLAGEGNDAFVEALFFNAAGVQFAFMDGRWGVRRGDWSVQVPRLGVFLKHLVRAGRLEARTEVASGEQLRAVFETRGAAHAVAPVIHACRAAREEAGRE